MHIFRCSLVETVIADDIKIVKVITIFKASDAMTLTTTSQSTFYHVFSEMLERIMYKQLLNHLLKHSLLYRKLFGFPQGHSTERL